MDSDKTSVPYFVLALTLTIMAILVGNALLFNTLPFFLFCILFAAFLIKPGISLVIVILSMLLPGFGMHDVPVAQIPASAVSIRMQDIVLWAFVSAWLIRAGLTRGISSFPRSRLSLLFFVYILWHVISTLVASLFEPVDLGKAFLIIQLAAEYLTLFLIVQYELKNMKQAKLFVILFLVAAMIVAVSSHLNILNKLHILKEMMANPQAASVQGFRAMIPGDVPTGSPNTFGGYLVFMIGIAAGLALNMRSPAIRASLICLIALMLVALLYTFSRAAYIGVIFVALALIFYMKKKTPVLIVLFFIIALLLIFFMPKMVDERIRQTASAAAAILNNSDVISDWSIKVRFETFKRLVYEWFPSSPLFGHGVGKYFIDIQVLLTLVEAGVVGAALLVLMLVKLFKMTLETLRLEAVKRDGFASGLCIGFLCAFIGLMAFSMGNPFRRTEIMEPFWFIAAIVISLPRLLGQTEQGAAVENANTAGGFVPGKYIHKRRHIHRII